MILSHRHRFIFLKTGKTAGTSVELFLRQVCGPDDVITPVSVEDEVLAQEIGAPGPQHWGPRRRSPREAASNKLRRLRGKNSVRRPSTYWNHMSARTVRATVGEEIWNGYHKFSIVRDPWDQVVSRYFWQTRFHDEQGLTRSREDLDQAVDGAGNSSRIFCIDGEIAVDTMLRFETLQDDLERLCRELGIDTPVVLPRAKSGSRPRGLGAADVLTDADAERIATSAHWVIERFGYTWPGSNLSTPPTHG